MMYLRRTKIQQNPYEHYLDDNRVTEVVLKLAKKERVSPIIYTKALFVAMREIVDPNKQLFNTLHNYDEPAACYILNCNSNEYCVLRFHEPRLIQERGILESDLLVKTYINLIAFYLFRTENPHATLPNIAEFIQWVENQIMQNTITYDSQNHTADVVIPSKHLIALLKHESAQRVVQAAKNPEDSTFKSRLKPLRKLIG